MGFDVSIKIWAVLPLYFWRAPLQNNWGALLRATPRHPTPDILVARRIYCHWAGGISNSMYSSPCETSLVFCTVLGQDWTKYPASTVKTLCNVCAPPPFDRLIKHYHQLHDTGMFQRHGEDVQEDVANLAWKKWVLKDALNYERRLAPHLRQQQ